VEKKIWKKRRDTPNFVLEVEYLTCVPDISFSRSKDIKVFRMIEMH
jgi:hypothetical protein